MTYLYGDSTPSGLTSNFLEMLRDALDFAVCVLQADESIGAGKAKADELRAVAAAELVHLDAFTAVVASAIEGADKGPGGSPTARAAGEVSELLGGVGRRTSDAIRVRLASDLAALAALEAEARGGCHDALAAFLAPHGPVLGEPFAPTAAPGARASVAQRIALTDTGAYRATLAGRAMFGVDWTFELHVPDGNFWSQPLRLDRIADPVEIRAPQVAGWLTKEVRVRPQRLERHTVTELVADGVRTSVKLRVEATVETGFDLEVTRDGGAPALRMTRIGPADDAAAGAFDVDPSDAPTLVGIVDRITEAAAELEIGALVEARCPERDGAAFRDVPLFAPLVERLVSELAPVVHAIAKRSLTPTELVLRRALTDDRREEIFVTKATLRDKYAPLPERARAVFAPLGLDERVGSESPPRPREPSAPSRAELGRSPRLPPPRAPPPPSAAPPPSGSAAKNEAFVEAVKKIMLVLKSGRTDDGYSQYAELLSSPAFVAYRLDEQRQALKLLLLAKAPDGRSDAVTSAYRIALARIQALVDAHAEPADYEMLGVAHVQLDDRPSAVAAFEIALKLERARDPASELCASLGRRMSQLG